MASTILYRICSHAMHLMLRDDKLSDIPMVCMDNLLKTKTPSPAFLVAGGNLLIIEKILSEDPADNPPARTLDMHLLRLLDGRERTLKEYGKLLADHGLKIEKTVRTPGDVYAYTADAMLAVKE